VRCRANARERLRGFYTRAGFFIEIFISISVILLRPYRSQEYTGNGSDLRRRHRRLLRAVHRVRRGLRQASPQRVGRPPMSAWMVWLASASTLLLLVYLVYALLRAEALE